MRALALALLLAAPAAADPVPGVPVDQAYALIRETMLDFHGSPDAMLARFSSLPGGIWDHAPLVVDYPADPQALRLRMAMEMDAGGNAFLDSRQLDCTRLGAAGLAAVNAQEPIEPTAAPGATQPPFDLATEAMALQSLAFTASQLAPNAQGAVMACTMTIALSPEADPEATLQALVAADFAGMERHPEGAIDFFDGLPAPQGTLAVMRLSVTTLETGSRFLYLTAFSYEATPAS